MPARHADSPAILVAIGAVALLAVVALFQSVLDPPPNDGCNTSLPPGSFRMALVPAHLAAAAVLGACLWSLGASRVGLAAVAVVALACVAVPGVFGLIGLVAVIAAPTVGTLAVAALLIRSALVARSVRDPAERRAALATSARVALWLALVLALPANLAYAWMRGASVFCF